MDASACLSRVSERGGNGTGPPSVHRSETFLQPIYPISGRVPFHRVGALRPARAIGEPWQDGHGARSDDDREELGGADRWVSAEVSNRSHRMLADARARRATRVRPATPPVGESASSVRKSVRSGKDAGPPLRPLPRPPGSGMFQGGSAMEAVLAYGDAWHAWTRLQQAGRNHAS